MNYVALQIVGTLATVRAYLAGYVTFDPSNQEYYDTELKSLILALVDKNDARSEGNVQVTLYAQKMLNEQEQPVNTFEFKLDTFPYEIV